MDNGLNFLGYYSCHFLIGIDWRTEGHATFVGQRLFIKSDIKYFVASSIAMCAQLFCPLPIWQWLKLVWGGKKTTSVNKTKMKREE